MLYHPLSITPVTDEVVAVVERVCREDSRRLSATLVRLLGGILILEARDLNHAIALMSKHPGVRFGPFEIHPADETIHALIAQRNAAARA